MYNILFYPVGIKMSFENICFCFIMLYEFKKDIKAVSRAKNINEAFSSEVITERIC